MSEDQADFRPGRCFIGQIFTLQQILEHEHTFRRPGISVFSNLKAAPNIADCGGYSGWLSLSRGISFTMYANSQSRVLAYGDVSPEITKRSTARQFCLLPLLHFNFVKEMVTEIAQLLSKNKREWYELRICGCRCATERRFKCNTVSVSQITEVRTSALLMGLYSSSLSGTRCKRKEVKISKRNSGVLVNNSDLLSSIHHIKQVPGFLRLSE